MIVTFYSFKGGVGRSMAMANVARWLQLRGLNVTVVDWDLEAPGLEAFFFSGPEALQDVQAIQSSIGLVDLLVTYRSGYASLFHDRPQAPSLRAGVADDMHLPPDAQALAGAGAAVDAALAEDVRRLREALPPLRFSLKEIRSLPPGVDPSSAGKLRILPAGLRSGEHFARYANTVQSFDWSDFYASYRGRAFFEWLRTELDDPALADVTLIDSRTGVTEMGGVCTRHLADVIVVFVAPNRQNLAGSALVARSFGPPEVLRERGADRPISIVMVPSRVDVSSDIKGEFERRFDALADGFLPPSLAHVGARCAALRIPYVSRYAFEERLVVGAEEGDRDMVESYRRIGAYVGWLAPAGGRVRERLGDDFLGVFDPALARHEIGIERFDVAWTTLDPALHEPARDLLLRLVSVPSTGPADHAVALPLRRLEPVGPSGSTGDRADRCPQPGGLVDVLVKAGLVRVEPEADGVTAVMPAWPGIAQHPKMVAWVEQDRALLLWRQRLATYVEDWQRTGHDRGALLQGSVLAEAEAMAADRPGRLLQDERDFIEASREAAAAASRGAATDATATSGPEPQAERTVPVVPPTLPGEYAWMQQAKHGEARAHGTVFPRKGLPVWQATAGAAVAVLGAVLLWFTLGRTEIGGGGGGGSGGPGGPPPVDAVANERAQALAEVLGRGASQLQAGAPDEAIAAYDAYLSRFGADPAILTARAGAQEKAGRLPMALADVDRALALAPLDPAARTLRGRLRAQTNDDAGALEDFDTALSAGNAGGRSPSIDALLGRAEALADLGRSDASRTAYDAAWEAVRKPGADTALLGRVLLGRARVAAAMGDTPAAIADLQAVLDGQTLESEQRLARARLALLSPTSAQQPVQAQPARERRVRIYGLEADRALWPDLQRAVRDAGLTPPRSIYPIGDKVDSAPLNPRNGTVRYFFKADRDAAQRARDAVQNALASAGHDVRIGLLLMDPQQFASPPAAGTIEIWLPTTSIVGRQDAPGGKAPSTVSTRRTS